MNGIGETASSLAGRHVPNSNVPRAVLFRLFRFLKWAASHRPDFSPATLASSAWLHRNEKES